MNREQLNEIALKNKSVAKLIEKIKWRKHNHTTYEVLRVVLKDFQIDTNEQELRNILEAKI
jgi:hypothetical protein